MALIDVTELLYDADFCDNFVVIKRAATVNEFGETEITESRETSVGVVQNATEEALTFKESGVQLSSAIKVYSKAKISAQTDGRLSDVIEWKGERYLVKTVQPWYNYGGGFCRATCVIEREAR